MKRAVFMTMSTLVLTLGMSAGSVAAPTELKAIPVSNVQKDGQQREGVRITWNKSSNKQLFKVVRRDNVDGRKGPSKVLYFGRGKSGQQFFDDNERELTQSSYYYLYVKDRANTWHLRHQIFTASKGKTLAIR